MGIVQRRVSRKDQTEDHAHKMPDGTMTGGALNKPTKDRMFPHTHLYQFEGKTCETDVAEEGPGHVHEVAGGNTGGPVAVSKDRGTAIPRNDSKAVSYKGATIYVNQYSDGDFEAYVHERYIPSRPKFTGKSEQEVVAKCKQAIDKAVASGQLKSS